MRIIGEITFVEDREGYGMPNFAVTQVTRETPGYITVRGRFLTSKVVGYSLEGDYGPFREQTFPWHQVESIDWGGRFNNLTMKDAVDADALENRIAVLETRLATEEHWS